MQTSVYGDRIYWIVDANFWLCQNLLRMGCPWRTLRNNMMHFFITSVIWRLLYFGKTVRKLLFYLLRYVAD